MPFTWRILFLLCAFAGWCLGATVRWSNRPPDLLNRL